MKFIGSDVGIPTDNKLEEIDFDAAMEYVVDNRVLRVGSGCIKVKAKIRKRDGYSELCELNGALILYLYKEKIHTVYKEIVPDIKSITLHLLFRNRSELAITVKDSK
jgi:hypothetical protein